MISKPHTPELLLNALAKPKAKENCEITQGFYYAYQDDTHVVLFTPEICAN